MAYRFDLEKGIQRTMRKCGIKNISSTSEWNYVLNKTFAPGIHKNCTRLDLDKLEVLAHKYIFVCYIYGQCVSLHGFSLLAGISRQTFYDWYSGKSRRDNMQTARIFVALREERCISVMNALDSPTKVLGALATLRHECSWTKEPIENFVDEYGLIQPSKQSVLERYKAVLKA